jgi:hypothetical protein
MGNKLFSVVNTLRIGVFVSIVALTFLSSVSARNKFDPLAPEFTGKRAAAKHPAGLSVSPVTTANTVDGGVIEFSSPTFTVNEIVWGISLIVWRKGDLSQAVTVDYATSDLTANAGKDYLGTRGTLHFAPGAGGASIQIFVYTDKYVDAGEKLQVSLTNPTNGAVLGSPAVCEVQIDDTFYPNAVDGADDFVKRHYVDFLNRLAANDQAGLQFWTNQIIDCEYDSAHCDVEARRMNVSASFFLSIEFQQTGYLVERFYRVAYGEAAATSNLNGGHWMSVPVIRYSEFLSDTQQMGGVVVGWPGWQSLLENHKVAFANDFVQRPRFTAAFPSEMTPVEFVDKLDANAGNPLSQSEREQLIAELSTNTKTRAQVVRAVAENPKFVAAEFNRAFVLIEYFGYLRRNPNDAPDMDYTGFDFWLTKLNQANGNYIESEMIKAFITSIEYRQRFGI